MERERFVVSSFIPGETLEKSEIGPDRHLQRAAFSLRRRLRASGVDEDITVEWHDRDAGVEIIASGLRPVLPEEAD